ncbi:hypothetical protein QCA50_013472 [Cerrena zonata]|uniref:F-box domain-containing protein n=1 Tax=Cerrena zonata TaxID=2478898 RepID=A0AAW0FZN6_9APHY
MLCQSKRQKAFNETSLNTVEDQLEASSGTSMAKPQRNLYSHNSGPPRVAGLNPPAAGQNKTKQANKQQTSDALPDMLINILLEVLSQLYPSDLLHIARTTKAL